MIIDQIQERHQIRVKDQETKEREAFIMKKQSEAMMLEEEDKVR